MADAAITSVLPAELRSLLRSHPLRLAWPVAGRRTGMHRSRRVGQGQDFRDHRPYVPGDDLRQLDWRAAARHDRLVLRRTEAEQALNLVLLVDGHGGMAYGEPGETKWRTAGAMATALATLALRQGDSVGYAHVGHEGVEAERLRPTQDRARLERLASHFVAPPEQGRGAWRELVQSLPAQLRSRSLVVVLSDFLDLAVRPEDDADQAEAELLDGLALLRGRQHEVVLLQVLHRDEIDFPFNDPRVIRFEDLRGRLRPVEAPGSELRSTYLERMQAHLDGFAEGAERRGLRLHRLVSDQPLTSGLLELLARIAGEPAVQPGDFA